MKTHQRPRQTHGRHGRVGGRGRTDGGRVSVVQWRAVAGVGRAYHDLADDLTRSYTCSRRSTRSAARCSTHCRLRDPDELEKAVGTTRGPQGRRHADRGGRPWRGRRRRPNSRSVAATEQAVLEAVLRGDIAAASEQFLETASPSTKRRRAKSASTRRRRAPRRWPRWRATGRPCAPRVVTCSSASWSQSWPGCARSNGVPVRRITGELRRVADVALERQHSLVGGSWPGGQHQPVGLAGRHDAGRSARRD